LLVACSNGVYCCCGLLQYMHPHQHTSASVLEHTVKLQSAQICWCDRWCTSFVNTCFATASNTPCIKTMFSAGVSLVSSHEVRLGTPRVQPIAAHAYSATA
jgi:hypothetical protein